MNIGIILAAGRSRRFDHEIPKQLYPIGDKPMVQHSIDLLNKYLDKVIIVTNSEISNQISGDIVINDKDSRIESIKVALKKIDTCDNILIQDAARPYVTDWMIEELLESSNRNIHSQFYLPLMNGLAKKNFIG